MIIKLTIDNVNKYHIELLHDDGTAMIPRDGFSTLEEAAHAADTIQIDAAGADVQDFTTVKIYTE